jgi:hypothetical protein
MKMCQSRKFRFLIPVIFLALLAVFSLIVMLLWNGVLTTILPVRMIGYGQAAGLLILCRVLFGGFRPRGGPGGPFWRKRMALHAMHRWESMSPEEREKFKASMRERFGEWPRPPWCEPNTGEPASH